MNILLTFTGFHDPYFKGLVGQDEQPGPILSLLSARVFGQVILFSTPSTNQLTQETGLTAPTGACLMRKFAFAAGMNMTLL